MDLLTVLAHELGHVLGFDHEADGLMAETLAAMSQQATYMNEPRAGVDLARGARTLAEREGLSALVAET